MTLLLAVMGALVTAEIALQLSVRSLRRGFKWLINEADQCPALDQAALDKFLENGFDPLLGWSRKPNTKGQESSRGRKVAYSIDEKGSRSLGHLGLGGSPEIAAFGDSYAFCRQVDDAGTWQSFLAEQTGKPVLNYGVGNYGVDQAILRYETTELPEAVKTVVLAFVPETICRVQSYWKHYLEFGNTFAFKPRFIRREGMLELLPNLIDSAAAFRSYGEYLTRIQENDFFYASKFRRVQFRFPYVCSLWRAPVRHFSLLALLYKRALKRAIDRSDNFTEDAPFEYIMKSNVLDAHRLYSDPASTELLGAILQRFAESAAKRGHRPVILVLPQLMDLKIGQGDSYRQFFRKIGKNILTIDLTEELKSHPDLPGLYTEDFYGGHLSPRGNRMVAEALLRKTQ